MAEETQNAARIIPWNIVVTVVFNGLLGFGMLLVALFCMSDLEAAMESPMHYPFVEIFHNATRSRASFSRSSRAIASAASAASPACGRPSFRTTLRELVGKIRKCVAVARPKPVRNASNSRFMNDIEYAMVGNITPYVELTATKTSL